MCLQERSKFDESFRKYKAKFKFSDESSIERLRQIQVAGGECEATISSIVAPNMCQTLREPIYIVKASKIFNILSYFIEENYFYFESFLNIYNLSSFHIINILWFKLAVQPMDKINFF